MRVEEKKIGTSMLEISSFTLLTSVNAKLDLVFLFVKKTKVHIGYSDDLIVFWCSQVVYFLQLKTKGEYLSASSLDLDFNLPSGLGRDSRDSSILLVCDSALQRRWGSGGKVIFINICLGGKPPPCWPCKASLLI